MLWNIYSRGITFIETPWPPLNSWHMPHTVVAELTIVCFFSNNLPYGEQSCGHMLALYVKSPKRFFRRQGPLLGSVCGLLWCYLCIGINFLLFQKKIKRVLGGTDSYYFGVPRLRDIQEMTRCQLQYDMIPEFPYCHFLKGYTSLY
jgi:hypothetical protein